MTPPAISPRRRDRLECLAPGKSECAEATRTQGRPLPVSRTDYQSHRATIHALVIEFKIGPISATAPKMSLVPLDLKVARLFDENANKHFATTSSTCLDFPLLVTRGCWPTDGGQDVVGLRDPSSCQAGSLQAHAKQLFGCGCRNWRSCLC